MKQLYWGMRLYGYILKIFLFLALGVSVFAIEETSLTEVYVVPVQGEITEPQHYIIRRALKEAQEAGVRYVVLKLDTPGGAVDVTLEILDTIERYEGTVIAFVDTEALSAGAFIAGGTHAIYMAPKSVIGAAAVIQSTGQDVPKTARLKLESFLQAKLRTVGGGAIATGPKCCAQCLMKIMN